MEQRRTEWLTWVSQKACLSAPPCCIGTPSSWLRFIISMIACSAEDSVRLLASAPFSLLIAMYLYVYVLKIWSARRERCWCFNAIWNHSKSMKEPAMALPMSTVKDFKLIETARSRSGMATVGFFYVVTYRRSDVHCWHATSHYCTCTIVQ